MIVYWLGEITAKKIDWFQAGKLGKLVLYRTGGELVIAVNEPDETMSALLNEFLGGIGFRHYGDQNPLLEHCSYFVVLYPNNVEHFFSRSGCTLKPLGWRAGEVVVAVRCTSSREKIGVSLARCIGDIVIYCGDADDVTASIEKIKSSGLVAALTKLPEGRQHQQSFFVSDSGHLVSRGAGTLYDTLGRLMFTLTQGFIVVDARNLYDSDAIYRIAPVAPAV